MPTESASVKGARSKNRRRGERLIVTTGDERLVLVPNPERTARAIGRRMTSSAGATVAERAQQGRSRSDCRHPRHGAHREKRRLLVPLSHTGIRHVAKATWRPFSPLLSTMATRFTETGATGRRADK
jgi:hypothetical protein